MRRHFLLITVLTLIIFFCFTSCRKDGVYNPKKKIHKIYTQKDNEKKTLIETWTWNEKKLSRIDYANYYSLFEYDGKQIAKITSSNGSYTNFIYDGSKINKMEYYENDKLSIHYIFEHDGNKVSKIVVEEYAENIDSKYSNLKSFEDSRIKALRFVLPEQSCSTISNYSLQKKNRKANSIDTTTISLTWYGKNVVKMIFEKISDGKVYTSTSTYNHDNKKNPLYDFLSYNLDDPVFGYSKNNITRDFIKDSDNQSWEYTYSYLYDGNFPIQSTRVYRIGLNDNILITYYEYGN